MQKNLIIYHNVAALAGTDKVVIFSYTAVPNVCADRTLKVTVTKPIFWK